MTAETHLLSDTSAWNGWADVRSRRGLPEHARAWLRRELGTGTPSSPVPLADAELRPSRLPDDVRSRLAAVVGSDGVADDRAARAARAGGKSYLDLLRRRAGDLLGAPDAVVFPASHHEVCEVLGVCAAQDVAVVPYGGGTSVVGGLEPVRGGHRALVSLDLSRLAALHEVDSESLTVRVGPGLRGPVAESLLAAEGLTLGHLPQSHEQATLGGYAVTRSAGQASTGYGRFDDLVVGLRAATPAGDLDLGRAPASAAGPDLRQLVLGSEGTLGIVTELTLQVQPRPRAQRFEAWFFPTFATGAAALRTLVQEGLAADVCRLSDEEETRTSLALSGISGLKGLLGRTYLRARGVASGCLVILGYDGAGESVVKRRASAAAKVLRAAGGVPAGRAPGEAWAKGRFEGPHLRDDLLDAGYLVETLETATSWSRLPALREAVVGSLRSRLGAAGTPPVVLCHVSHLYPAGASLYVTVLARQLDGDLESRAEQWQNAKNAATETLLAAGGTLTHHHGVGVDHRGWMSAEVGDVGVRALRAVKEALDPQGILNPGKLLPAETAPPGDRP
jgi:alkyldihydroxyacetonephosphate synthase